MGIVIKILEVLTLSTIIVVYINLVVDSVEEHFKIDLGTQIKKK